jgi:hypothetical protein
VYRLFDIAAPDEMASQLVVLLGDQRSAAATRQALEFGNVLFGSATATGVRLGVEALRTTIPESTAAAVLTGYWTALSALMAPKPRLGRHHFHFGIRTKASALGHQAAKHDELRPGTEVMHDANEGAFGRGPCSASAGWSLGIHDLPQMLGGILTSNADRHDMLMQLRFEFTVGVMAIRRRQHPTGGFIPAPAPHPDRM